MAYNPPAVAAVNQVMASSQVLAKGDASAILDPGRLTIERDRKSTKIPLAAVQEARPDGDTAVQVVLTDGVVHRIEGANPTATAAFLTALNDALPEARDPGGSALVTVDAQPPQIKVAQLVGGICAVVLAYIGYVVWAGSHEAGTWPIVLVSGVPLVIGLLGVAILVINGRDRMVLARRGITVRAVRAYHPNGKKLGYYTFTDANGDRYSHFASRSTEGIHVVYDPENPHCKVARGSLVLVVLRHAVGWIFSLGCLALGLAGALTPFL